MRILVVNAGSSTLKLSVLDGDHVDAERTIDPRDGTADAVDLTGLDGVDAAGHRVVHGGRNLRAAIVDDDIMGRIAALAPLAPLHQPRRCRARRRPPRAPERPARRLLRHRVHATLPAAARTYALPAPWRERWGLERFGFHGLSHAWAARQGPAQAGLDPGVRIVSCHLGAGASLCAIADGRSVDTTMGFTPRDGIVMATRAGAVDPGLLLWLLGDAGLDTAAVRDGLERHAGLAGLSGGGGDMREVLAGRRAGDACAALAFDVYVHRMRQGIAAVAASLGDVDLLVFTGGVGEHAAPVRESAVAGPPLLDATVEVVESREDREITRQVREVLA
jgi:acetate kinase